MTETKLNESALKELFARALLAKLTTQRSFRPGKHFRVRGSGGVKWPAGWKMIRKRWFRDGNIFHGVERTTGERALLRIPVEGENVGKLVAQYNRFDHEHSHGWHVVDPFNWSVYNYGA